MHANLLYDKQWTHILKHPKWTWLKIHLDLSLDSWHKSFCIVNNFSLHYQANWHWSTLDTISQLISLHVWDTNHHPNSTQWSILQILLHNGPENLKKSRQKNSRNQINQKKISWIFICGSLKLFPSSKFDFWAIFEIAKNGIWSK